ncbi:purine phosphoribosyltransferase [Cryptosporangium phraense]|uniref:Purine phosphoribosyltransferase n=2 Tax=Cryptosporangium phraense TaxID=2593070 RepID=A0A545ANI0_9ACTN|nr:purine phosphoribosyltransferase [Cryptosporangium phraense]
MLGWVDFERAVADLADQVRADGAPEVVVGVLRGGMVPAVALAHTLAIRAVRAVEVVHTATDDTNATKYDRPQVFNPASLGNLAGLDVLVVDDVAGTGDTLKTAAALAIDVGAARVRTSAWIVNTANWRLSTAPEQALTYIAATVEGWVVFPWEKQ